MTWQDTIRERLKANIDNLDCLTEEQKASLLESELEQVVLATEAGQQEHKESTAADAADDAEEPDEETAISKKTKVKLLLDTFAPGGWPSVKSSGTK